MAGWVCQMCEETVDGRPVDFHRHVKAEHAGERSVVGIEEGMMVDPDGVQTLVELRARLAEPNGLEGVL